MTDKWKVFPAMDLLDGQCVRLLKGQFDQVTSYSHSPLDQAREFFDQGARYLHLVDLEGARDPEKRQLQLIEKIASQTQLRIQVGGGIRSRQDVEQLFEAGVERVIVGTMAIKNIELTSEIISQNPSGIVVALDVQIKDGKSFVSYNAWQSESDLGPADLINKYLRYGLKNILCTDIGRDGTMSSPNFELYQGIQQQFPDLAILASGGIHAISDLVRLRKLHLDGVILGKSLYEGRIGLAEALNAG